MACVYIQHSARCAAFEQNNETALQRRPKVTGNADLKESKRRDYRRGKGREVFSLKP